MSDSDIPIGLPDLQQAELDNNTIRSLFRDIGALTRVLEIIPKTGARSMVPEAVSNLTLDSAADALLSGSVRGIQLRYEFEGSQWWDSVIALPQPGTFRLVRIQHDPATFDSLS